MRKQETPEVEKVKKVRHVPPLAFFYVLLIGILGLIWGVSESFSGFTTSPVRSGLAIGGIMEGLTFGCGFLLVAGLLWVNPRLGGFLLALLGAAVAILFRFKFDLVSFILAYIPILLGLFTLFRRSHPKGHDTIQPHAVR